MQTGAAAGLSVVVAHGNALTRRGMVAVLAEAGAHVLAEEADTPHALRALAEAQPDVLVVALDLPGSDRGHIVAIARDRWPELAVVAVGAGHADTALLDALELGASAYLPPTVTPAQLLARTVQAAASPGAFQAEGLSAARSRGRDRGPQLTPRETEVLRLAAEGLTVRAISARLYVSEATTRSHLSGIYHKLGVSSRSRAVLVAERLGMLR